MDAAQRTILTQMAYDASVKRVGEGLATIKHARAVNGGFLSETDLERIAGDEKTQRTMILVRCGGGRLNAPACQVQHFIDIITREDTDHVRDISLPAISQREEALLNALQAAWGMLVWPSIARTIHDGGGMGMATYNNALMLARAAVELVGGAL